MDINKMTANTSSIEHIPARIIHDNCLLRLEDLPDYVETLVLKNVCLVGKKRIYVGNVVCDNVCFSGSYPPFIHRNN